ncbi:MAG: hypothetical protein PWR25_427 [Euryarchaeota archaeon]|jgi:hypothetical protein|nr:hypothetical protein [Euryarchaeota archaeon]MDN5339439.1 hypothetical protein [Euryarchaeota archaeon]
MTTFVTFARLILSSEKGMSEDHEEYAPAVCCHCEGAGCMYCNKKGTVMVPQPPQKCHHCNGDCCIYCGYTGWERPLKEY